MGRTRPPYPLVSPVPRTPNMPCRTPTTSASCSWSGRVFSTALSVASFSVPSVTRSCGSSPPTGAFGASSLLMRGPRGGESGVSWRAQRAASWGASSQQALHVGGRQRVEGHGLELLDLGATVRAELGRLDLLVQLEDRVDEHLGPRRAAGEVH